MVVVVVVVVFVVDAVVSRYDAITDDKNFVIKSAGEKTPILSFG